MLAEKDIDVVVAEARALAVRLNGVLDLLHTSGIHCVSVAGPPRQIDFVGAVCPNATRVSLVLEFKPARKSGDAE